MIEMRQLDLDAGTTHIGFAGDTLNTAVYLARLGVDVAYITNLGRDRFSDRMELDWRREGINCDLVGRHPDRLPGIYAIEVDPSGERSFRYWRDASAARTLFSGVGAEFGDLAQFDVIYLSGITLAIVAPDIRAALILQAKQLKAAGKQVVFDTNYRPRLWPDDATAKQCFSAMWAATTLALPSFDDEQRLFPGSTAQQIVARIAGHGPPEVVLKSGARGPLIHASGQTSQTDFAVASQVVDTSGAGDSFNAGYLAARLQGADPIAAAASGHRLATTVIACHGAIIPRAPLQGWQ